MKFKCCCLSLLLSFCLLLSVPIISFADLATDSQAVVIDRESIQPFSIGIAPRSSISTIENTVNYNGVLAVLVYYDMSNNIHTSYNQVNSDGSFSFPRPLNYSSPIRFGVYLNSLAIPSSGIFRVVADFGMHTPMTYSSSTVGVGRGNTNASWESNYSSAFSLVQSYGDFQISGNVEFGVASSMEISALISGIVPSDISGVVKINFSRTTSSPNLTSPGSDSVGQDIQNNISDNTGKMAAEQEKTNGFLVEIIQTISNQLKSFWDQLAGEFTNLYNKMNQHHQEDLQKIDDQTFAITENDNKNTNILTSALERLGNFLIDGLKGLFIPSDDFFQTYFDDLFSWFSDRLGFLSFPIDLLAQLVEMFLGSSSTDFIVTLPSFDIMGESLFQEASFNLTQFLNENFGFVLNAIRLGVSLIIIFNFIKLCERKWEEVMMN